MTVDSKPNHLIERAAARLRADGPAPSGPAAQAPLAMPPPAVLPLPGQSPGQPPLPPMGTPPAAPVGGPVQAPIAPGGTSLPELAEGTPAIGMEALEQAGLAVARAARTRVSEEFRIVVGRVMRAAWGTDERDECQNILMVTSARPGEGKSFTALNLAGSIARHGPDKVLLVDVDGKPRSLSVLLGVSAEPGFLDLIADSTLNPAKLALRTALPNLSVLPIGTRRAEGAVSGGRAVAPVIEQIGRVFPNHLVVLDAPPCLSTSDPHTIAPHVGQIVMVVEAQRTQRNEVEAALDLVRVCPSITMMLNKVKMATDHSFGTYDYYGSYA